MKICKKRINEKKGTVTFVSREMPTAIANENRIMDLLESSVSEAKTLAQRFMIEDLIDGEFHEGAYDDEVLQRESARLALGLPPISV